MNGALPQAFAHQRKLAGFQVAQSAMNELAGAARGAGRERFALDEQCAVSGRDGSLEHAGAMNAAADDDHIVFFHLHWGFDRWRLECVITREHTNFESLSPFANSREGSVDADFSFRDSSLPASFSRFSSNCITGVSEVTSISPSTIAPLAMATVRALTLPRITAV